MGESPAPVPSAFSMPMPQEVVDREICPYSSGSIFQKKIRVYHHFMEQHTEDERVKFIKEEFGIYAGHSPLDEHDFWVKHSSKGIIFTKGDQLNPDITYTLSWKNAVKRIRELIAADRYLTPQEIEQLYPQYLEYLEQQAILREKERFIDSVASLPPEEKRDTLSLRLADYINVLPGHEKGYLGKHGLPEIADTTNTAQIDALLQNPQTVQQLISALAEIKGATSGVFTRNHAWRFGEELAALFPHKHVYHLGDTVYIGTREYELLAFDDNTVRLYDTEFPLFNKEMPRAEFDQKIAENTMNDHLLAISGQVAPTAVRRPTVLEEYQKIKDENPGCIVMYQLGDFFELFGEDAEIAAHILGLALISRDAGLPERVKMVGIPSHRQEEYAKKLIDAGHTVVVAAKPYGEQNRTVSRIGEPAPEPVPTEPVWEKIEGGEVTRVIIDLMPDTDKTTTPDKIAPAWEKPKPRGRAQTFDPHPEIPMSQRHNYVITDDNLGAGGPKAKYAMNVTAIRTLQTIERENRFVTPEEQEILARYVGWGGLQQVFDPENTSWTNEYAELKSLLTPEEYASARASTLNAHYTSPTVIKAIYKAVENMGFKAGNVLEPSCGIGNFLACCRNP